MAKRFNTTGCCNPERHYMVNIDDKLEQIEALIDDGFYFTINRARQFGKTTTMNFLQKKLEEKYYVYFISFEIDADMFSSAKNFCTGLFAKLSRSFNIPQEQKEYWTRDFNCRNYDDLSVVIRNFCERLDKPVVLMIDEVDKSTDNQLFLHFLGMLRNMYLDRDSEGMKSSFHSVILAGVYDVKNLKLKIRDDEERKYNSPWNIAVRFTVDMTFSTDGIKGMLDEYEADYHTGMDTLMIAAEIRRLTSGYPVLVSYICSFIHDELKGDWTIEGVNKAAKLIIKGDNTLADDISKNLENKADLRDFMYSISVNGTSYSYNLTDPVLRFADMFSYIKEVNGVTAIHNMIFEEIFHQYFTIAYERANINKITPVKSEYIVNGKLNVEYVINRFKDLIEDEYRNEDSDFLERQGRLLFLCFLKPIINGTGFYYVEPQTRDSKRMDIVVTYDREEYIIELKIWYGTKYERKGEVQVAEYAQTRGLKKAYLITFSFLKDKIVQEEPEWKNVDGVDVYEGIIWAKKN